MSVGNEIAEQEFRERMGIEGWLGQHLTEQMWGHYGTLRLGSDDFEVIGSDEVPGYDENLEGTVLLRRKTDGKVFEAEIEVTVRVARMSETATTGVQQ